MPVAGASQEGVSIVLSRCVFLPCGTRGGRHAHSISEHREGGVTNPDRPEVTGQPPWFCSRSEDWGKRGHDRNPASKGAPGQSASANARSVWHTAGAVAINFEGLCRDGVGIIPHPWGSVRKAVATRRICFRVCPLRGLKSTATIVSPLRGLRFRLLGARRSFAKTTTEGGLVA
jgi:hypothetical protein